MSELRRSLLQGRRQRGSWQPREWTEFFTSRCQVALDTERQFEVYLAGPEEAEVLVVLLHGAGASAMSFAECARILGRQHRVLSFDMRGHGHTVCSDENLEIGRIVQDAADVVNKYASGKKLCLVGHSFGGAVAVRLCASGLLLKQPIVCAVIDVVEGTAMAALPRMESVLARRPSRFASEEEAIRWAVRTGAVKRRDSARASMPDQLVRVVDEGTGEECYKWRTNLQASKPFWEAWYRGMSAQFLSLPCSRVLICAGADRLDRELTLAVMQGRFCNLFVNGTGHFVHEDAPEQTADCLQKAIERATGKDAASERLRQLNAQWHRLEQQQPHSNSNSDSE